jgi:hypothetical protein
MSMGVAIGPAIFSRTLSASSQNVAACARPAQAIAAANTADDTYTFALMKN